jgi:hypothetical protein
MDDTNGVIVFFFSSFFGYLFRSALRDGFSAAAARVVMSP